jgi:hypothetical protein
MVNLIFAVMAVLIGTILARPAENADCQQSAISAIEAFHKGHGQYVRTCPRYNTHGCSDISKYGAGSRSNGGSGCSSKSGGKTSRRRFWEQQSNWGWSGLRLHCWTTTAHPLCSKEQGMLVALLRGTLYMLIFTAFEIESRWMNEWCLHIIK